VHHRSDGTYGVPRVTAELRETGDPVNHKRVARSCATSAWPGLRLRRRHRTTIADPAADQAPDLIGRDFTAAAPNLRYVGDITYLPFGDRGFLYLATVIDLHSRGWPATPSPTTCAPNWSSTPSHTAPTEPGQPGRAIMHTTTALNTHRRPTPKHVRPPEYADRCPQSDPAPTTPPRNRSTPASNARPYKGPAGVHRRTRRPADRVPLATTATTPSAATPDSDTEVPALRDHPHHTIKYNWQPPHNPVSQHPGSSPASA